MLAAGNRYFFLGYRLTPFFLCWHLEGIIDCLPVLPYLCPVHFQSFVVIFKVQSPTLAKLKYGITSLSSQKADPKRLLSVVRSEWGIENGLHYRCDVTYQEDQTRMTEKPMGRVMAIINNLVISLIHHLG